MEGRGGGGEAERGGKQPCPVLQCQRKLSALTPLLSFSTTEAQNLIDSITPSPQLRHHDELFVLGGLRCCHSVPAVLPASLPPLPFAIAVWQSVRCPAPAASFQASILCILDGGHFIPLHST